MTCGCRFLFCPLSCSKIEGTTQYTVSEVVEKIKNITLSAFGNVQPVLGIQEAEKAYGARCLGSESTVACQLQSIEFS